MKFEGPLCGKPRGSGIGTCDKEMVQGFLGSKTELACGIGNGKDVGQSFLGWDYVMKAFPTEVMDSGGGPFACQIVWNSLAWGLG